MSLQLGLHVSIAGSIDQAVDRAKERGCTIFQIFTRNPRGWKAKLITEEEIREFMRKTKDYGYKAPVSHMPYLPNLASPADGLYALSVEALVSEVERCGRLGIPYVVTHLGSHLGKGKAVGAERIVNACNTALAKNPNAVMILLENTAGQKNSMGSSFDDLKYLLEKIRPRERVGVCFDTCHAFAAGYDLRSKASVQQTLNLFGEIVGFEHLRVVHINDSKGALNSGLDRHEHIGLGQIGTKGFKAILHEDRIRKLPLILETPLDSRRDDRGNLRKVRELAS